MTVPERCNADILGTGLLCARKAGHVYPGKKLCTQDVGLAEWLDSHDLPLRAKLSVEAQVELLLSCLRAP